MPNYKYAHKSNLATITVSGQTEEEARAIMHGLVNWEFGACKENWRRVI